MSREPIFYSCDPDEEHLTHEDRDEAIEAFLDDLEPAETPDRITVYGFARLVESESGRTQQAERVLSRFLEELEEAYGDPDGARETKPSEGMKVAARAFVDDVWAQYTPWFCEQVTAEEIDVQKWLREYASHWLPSPEAVAQTAPPELPLSGINPQHPEGPQSGGPSDPPRATACPTMGSSAAVSGEGRD